MKTTLRQHVHLSDWKKSKSSITHVLARIWVIRHSHTFLYNLYNLCVGQFGCMYKTTMSYNLQSAILLLVIYPTNTFHKCEIIYVTKVFTAALLVIARDWKFPKSLSIWGWLNK